MADDERTTLTCEQAIALLPEGEQVHTILDGGIALIGAGWDREDVLSLLRTGHSELAGEAATAMHHGLAAFRPSGPVFIETRPLCPDPSLCASGPHPHPQDTTCHLRPRDDDSAR